MSPLSFNKPIAATLCLLLLASMGVQTAAAQELTPKAKYVVLITVDGMRREMVEDPQMPAPTIQWLAKNGVWVKQMNCIAPSSTYPSHTSLVTGVRPARHGIYYNAPFLGNVNKSVSNWYADSIRAKTIWGAAKENGLVTCSLFWPVSTHGGDIDVNVPEYWSTQRGVDNLQFLREHSSPVGLFDEIQENATGILTSRNFNAGTRNREGRTGYMATYIFEKYRPHLSTIHFISTDIFQHSHGMHSDETKMSLAAVDYGINQVVEGLQRHQMWDSTVVIVCGDHGFTDAEKLIAPNVWLTDAGLLTADSVQWRAKFHGSGATMFLYLNDENDQQALATVRHKIQSLPDTTKALFRVVEKDELERLGCDPKVSLAVEPIIGVGVATATTGADVIYKQGGKHGYLTPHDPTTFVAFGPGLPKGRVIQEMNLTDVAQFAMEVLGIRFETPDSKRMPELFE